LWNAVEAWCLMATTRGTSVAECERAHVDFVEGRQGEGLCRPSEFSNTSTKGFVFH
jgi:hypothetical protein